MKNLFFIIEGGLATTRAPQRKNTDDKVVRFESQTEKDEPVSAFSPSSLRVLDDADGFGLVSAEPSACILDFEYNGVPARHGFIHD